MMRNILAISLIMIPTFALAQASKYDKTYHGPVTYIDISDTNIGEAGTSGTGNIGEAGTSGTGNIGEAGTSGTGNIGEAGTSETDNIDETEIDLGETHVINKTVKGDLLKNIKFVDFNISKKVIDSGTVSKMKVSK